MSEPRVVYTGGPGKINWTLEVLGKRPDGYHEVRTILQTADGDDEVTLVDAEGLELTVRGQARSFKRKPPEKNLAFQAAALLKERTGHPGGVHIILRKHIPVGSGMGGGSNDAAQVLGGLRELWRVQLSDEELVSLAAELGSDVPFFLFRGTALASGRGEIIEPLPTPKEHTVMTVWPSLPALENKTARMYAALRPEHYTDGSLTVRTAGRIRDSEPLRDEDLFNVFEQVLSEAYPRAASVFQEARELGGARPHLCGSGPAMFFLETQEHDLREVSRWVRRRGFRATGGWVSPGWHAWINPYTEQHA
jgi:4-diphosphocytidyl-2-C-methyl-D-erythritol kinase